MNEYGPPPDWESVFHHARRRMFGRLLFVAVLAALGAGLLLNGGLAAQGSAPWLPINKEAGNKPKQDHGQHHGNPHERHRQHEQQGDDGNGHPGHHKSDQDGKGHKKGKRKKGKSHDQWVPCPGDSAGTQYCDSPPQTPNGGPTGKTDTNTGDVAETDEVASTGEIAPVPED